MRFHPAESSSLSAIASGQPCPKFLSTADRRRRKPHLLRLRRKANTKCSHRARAQSFSCHLQCRDCPRGQWDKKAGHRAGGHENSFLCRLLCSSGWRWPVPWPIRIDHQPLHKAAEDRGHVSTIHWRTQHQCVCVLNLREDRFHTIVQNAFSSLRSCLLRAQTGSSCRTQRSYPAGISSLFQHRSLLRLREPRPPLNPARRPYDMSPELQVLELPSQ